MGDLISFLFATLFGPSDQFRRMRQVPQPSAGFNAVLLAAVALAGFNLVLWQAGHQPTVQGVIGGGSEAYKRQAMFAVPVFLVAWALYVMAARFLGSLLGGKGSSRALMGALGLALAVPLLFAFVVPDVVVYARKGHGALASAMKYYAPVCLLWLWALGTVAVREVEGISSARGAVVAGLSLMVMAAPIALFIR